MTIIRKRIVKALLAWYDVRRRDLPWRRDIEPYRVWVSEIMLQQTRVDAVTPYFERWLARFPTIEALANADIADVLKAWEGLGSYSRARNLHGATRLVRERLNGALPNTAQQLRELPGIGEYTAGAIASIAYGERAPAVDGNARRVLSRLYDVAAPNAASVRPYAEARLAPDRPGDFNQALMERGATICTPRQPLCSSCPLIAFCLAHARRTIAQRPGTKPRKPIPHYHVNTLIHLRRQQVLMVQRPDKGMLAGLWEFPEMKKPPVEARVIGKVTHTYSHKRITYVVYLLENARTKPKGHWVALDALNDYALPAAQRKIEALLHSHCHTRTHTPTHTHTRTRTRI